MKLRTKLAGAGLLLLFAAGGCGPKCYLKKDERVDFYPSYVYQQPDGHWAMPVMAWVHETEPSSDLAKGISKMVSLAALFPAAGTTAADMQTRVRPFLVRGRSGTKVPIQLETKTLQLNESDLDGYVKQDVLLPASPPIRSTGTWVTYKTPACKKDDRVFQGEAVVIPPEGLSVIADVEALATPNSSGSNADSTSALFQRYGVDPEWTPVFEKWKKDGAVFHYISASPNQLFPDVSLALQGQGLPHGVLQMKTLPLHMPTGSVDDLASSLSALFAAPAAYKGAALESLFERFPKRRFILVGDAAHEDAGIYAPVARRYPNQIEKIIIRDPAPQSEHYQAIFRGVPESKWKVARSPAD